MRGFRIGAGLRGALSAISGMMAGLDFRVMDPAPPMPRVQYKKPFAKEKGPRNRRSSQRGGKDRLIVDRSSSVRKLQRYLNNGTIIN